MTDNRPGVNTRSRTASAGNPLVRAIVPIGNIMDHVGGNAEVQAGLAEENALGQNGLEGRNLLNQPLLTVGNVLGIADIAIGNVPVQIGGGRDIMPVLGDVLGQIRAGDIAGNIANHGIHGNIAGNAIPNNQVQGGIGQGQAWGGLSPEVAALINGLQRQVQLLTMQMAANNRGNGENADMGLRKGQPFFKLYETTPLRGREDENIHQYFENFEYLARLVPNMTDQIMLEELKKSLRDNARQVFMDGSLEQTRSYVDAKAYLLGGLLPRNQQTISKHEFHSKVKGKDSVRVFYRELRRLADLAFAGQSRAVYDAMIAERLVYGCNFQTDKDQNYEIFKAGYKKVGGTAEEIAQEMDATEASLKSLALVWGYGNGGETSTGNGNYDNGRTNSKWTTDQDGGGQRR